MDVSLADAVLPLIRTRADLHRYSSANQHGQQMHEAIDILEDLQADTSGRDWFFIHPAGGFGAWNPGERTGTYRTGGDVIVTDADGESFISGADLAVAVLDEIENPQHVRGRFTVGY